jgi:hypothetical protein
MKKWEYKISQYSNPSLLDNIDLMAEAGLNGWEMVVLLKEDGYYRAVYKRELIEETNPYTEYWNEEYPEK